MSSRKFAVRFGGEVYYTDGSESLAELLGLERGCAGQGVCGRCEIVARGSLSPLTDTERGLLTEEKIRLGIRLACRTHATGDCEAELLKKEGEISVLLDSSSAVGGVTADFSGIGAAVDIGTTTIAARLYSSDGTLLATAGAENPQAKLGADVMSRIDMALSGKGAELVSLVRGAVNCILAALCEDAGIDTGELKRIVVTGNTAMLHFFADRDIEPLSRAPFISKHLFGEAIPSAELGLTVISEDAEVYLPPCISAFVGADIVCGALSTPLTERKNSLLVDVGTNGEMALWNGERITAASTAAGPAFEGVGISFGMRGTVGAIDRVGIDNEALRCHVIGDTEPVGICGSGLIDALACMLDLGAVDGGGFLEESTFRIFGGVSVNQRDIRMLQLAKSAVCAGLLTLLDSEKLDTDSVSELYLAGGFGNYMDRRNAARIGLLPEQLLSVTRSVGNSALEGASMLLLNKGLRATASELAVGAKVVDLATSPVFSELFTLGMSFGDR